MTLFYSWDSIDPAVKYIGAWLNTVLSQSKVPILSQVFESQLGQQNNILGTIMGWHYFVLGTALTQL